MNTTLLSYLLVKERCRILDSRAMKVVVMDFIYKLEPGRGLHCRTPPTSRRHCLVPCRLALSDFLSYPVLPVTRRSHVTCHLSCRVKLPTFHFSFVGANWLFVYQPSVALSLMTNYITLIISTAIVFGFCTRCGTLRYIMLLVQYARLRCHWMLTFVISHHIPNLFGE